MNQCEFSADRAYRYSLVYTDRGLFTADKRIAWIGLNPSTADETKLDATLRRVRNFTNDWGFNSFVMLNLFGFRSTLPEEMKQCPDPVGEENDETILRHAADCEYIVCAWGNDGHFMGRANIVMAMLEKFDLRHLKMTGLMQPIHPLYQAKHLRPMPLDRSKFKNQPEPSFK